MFHRGKVKLIFNANNKVLSCGKSQQKLENGRSHVVG